MIQLKTLLTEQTRSKKMNNSFDSNVLFIGDTKYNSYANKLIRNKQATGKVISKPNMTIDALSKLISKYVTDDYDIVSISLGNIGINEQPDYKELFPKLSDIFSDAKKFGAKLVVVPGNVNSLPDTKFRSRLFDINSWIRKQNIASSIIDIADTIDPDKVDSETQDNWIDSVNTVISTTAINNIDIDDSIVDQASALLRGFESIELTAYWDVNNWRIGYGSSTITTDTNKIIKLSNNKAKKPSFVITKEDAERDLSRRLLTEFIPYVVKEIGKVKLPNNVIAALTSIAYNYGEIPGPVKKAIRTANIQSIADAVRNLSSNKKRRIQEADFILKSKDDNILTPAGDIPDLDPIGNASISSTVLSTSAIGSNTYGIPGAQPGGEGGDWGGSMGRVLAFAKVAMDTMGKNYAGSQKRGRKLTASGNVSDHYLNNPIAYAVDMGVRTYKEGDQLLANLMAWFGRPDYKGGKWFNSIKDGYRYQVGWRVEDHYDHIHVGVKKIGATKDIPVDQLNKPNKNKSTDSTVTADIDQDSDMSLSSIVKSIV